MSDKSKAKLVEGVGLLMLQTAARPAEMFSGMQHNGTLNIAGVTAQNFLDILEQYALTLSVPQTIKNASAHFFDGEIRRIYPALADVIESLEMTRRDESFLDMLDQEGPEVIGAMMADDLVNGHEKMRAQAALAPEFNLPSGITKMEREEVCRDIRKLTECYHLSWEEHYHNIGAEEDDDPYTEEERSGFYGALKWIYGLLDKIESDDDLHEFALEFKDIALSDKSAAAPGQHLN